MSESNPMGARQMGSDVSDAAAAVVNAEAPPAPATPEPVIEAPAPAASVGQVSCPNCGTMLDVVQSAYGSTSPATCPVCYTPPAPVAVPEED